MQSGQSLVLAGCVSLAKIIKRLARDYPITTKLGSFEVSLSDQKAGVLKRVAELFGGLGCGEVVAVHIPWGIYYFI